LAAAGGITLQKRESYGCDLNHKCAVIVQRNLNREKVENRQGKGTTRKAESGKRREQRGIIGMGVRVRLRSIYSAAKQSGPQGA
jgi:hypothetical protein